MTLIHIIPLVNLLLLDIKGESLDQYTMQGQR
jgi:hypothetical protein